MRALEEEMLLRIRKQGLTMKPNIVVVSYSHARFHIKNREVNLFPPRPLIQRWKIFLGGSFDLNRWLGWYRMLKEQSATRNWSRYSIPSTATFSGFLSEHREGFFDNGFPASISILTWRDMLRQFFLPYNRSSLPQLFVHSNWLSFHQQDAAEKIMERMTCKPDLVIGNYSDGNLVASLFASKLGITQVWGKSATPGQVSWKTVLEILPGRTLFIETKVS